MPRATASGEAKTAPDNRDHLQTDLTHQLYRQAYSLVLGFPLATLIIAFFLRNSVPRALLVPWVLAILSISLYRFYLTRAFFRDHTPKDHCRRWINRYFALELAAGIAAGMSGMFFSFVPFQYQILILFVVVAEAAGGASLLSPVFRVYMAFLVPGIGIVAFWFLIQGHAVSLVMGILLPVFAFVMVGVAHSLNRSIANTFNLKYQNSELLGALEHSSRQLRMARDKAQASEDAMRKERDFAESLINTAQAIILVLDADGKIVRFNPYMAALSGYGLDEVKGADWFATFLAKQEVARVHDIFSETLDETKTKGRINSIITRNGDERIVEWYNKSLKRDDGSVAAVLAVGHDITERKKAEEALRLAKEQAERASAAKSLFLANMSHEIRTPMNGIATMVQVLSDSNLDDEQRDYADIILSSTKNLMRILDDILDLAKIESGALEIVEEAFSLRSLVSHCERLFQPVAERKGLAFEQEYHVAEGFDRVVGDQARLIQIINNLVDNAIKFTAQGRIGCRMTVRGRNPDESLMRIEVEDTGPGIPASEQERIFERFVQLSDGFDKRYAGTGLGLAVSRLLVEQMGGRIGVESEPGKGSVFFFELPLMTAKESPQTSPGAPDQPELAGRRLLVVDDDNIALLGAKLLLVNQGFEVTTAGDGNQALTLIHRTRFDAVLMDVHMPGLDGMETTRRIRADNDRRIAELPVIGVSASVLKNERRMYLKAGMNGVLAKPLDPEALRHMVSPLLQ